MTFEDMEKLRQSGALLGNSVGRTARRASGNARGAAGRLPISGGQKDVSGSLAGEGDASVDPASAEPTGKRFQRVNKNRPVEASSKKRPKKLQETLQVAKK